MTSAQLPFSEFSTSPYASTYTTWLHAVFPRTLFPNPVPPNKILLPYHPKWGEEHTLQTMMILRKMLPLHLTLCNQQTDYIWMCLSCIIVTTRRTHKLASESSVPCPSELWGMHCQQFCDSTPDAILHDLPEITLHCNIGTAISSSLHMLQNLSLLSRLSALELYSYQRDIIVNKITYPFPRLSFM